MYKMTLADGTVVEFAGLNGSNYITKDQTELDTSVFTDENLTFGSIIPEGEEDAAALDFKNWSFIQQQKQMNGDYYICFRQKTEEELDRERRAAESTDLQEAIVELYELLLGGEEA